MSRRTSSTPRSGRRRPPVPELPPSAPDADAAVRNAHTWFEHNSGWATPDPDTLAEWIADGVCRCPDGCLVQPWAWCEHGLATWWLILDALGEAAPLVPRPERLDPSRADYAAILAAHRRAMDEGSPGYLDPASGLFVLTGRYLLDRGACCTQGCRHCPY